MKKKIILLVLIFCGLAGFSAQDHSGLKACDRNFQLLTCKKKVVIKNVKTAIKNVKPVQKANGEENIPFNILMYHTKAL